MPALRQRGRDKIGRLAGKSTRIGVRKCYACRKAFTVKVGTIFESSRRCPALVWLQAIYLIASSKKGVSANQLHRTLGVTLKTAWFMGHRIREANARGQSWPDGRRRHDRQADETTMADADHQPATASAPHLAEFDFRHNNRVALGHWRREPRRSSSLIGIVGKRLTYQTTSGR